MHQHYAGSIEARLSIEHTTHPQSSWLNPHRRNVSSTRLLLNGFTPCWTLFKVLCNFPSRYLFAIGLVVIFSLRWGLPPALGCTFKQPDSKAAPTSRESVLWALHPLWVMAPLKGTWTAANRWRGLPKHHISEQRDAAGFGAGLIPFHSPLLGKSLLVSFPPLINMLKFSG